MDLVVRHAESRSVIIGGAIKNIFLSAIKIIFGITGNSHALFADGIHSLSDLLIDGMVLIASRFSNRAADPDHPYGHGRIETAATLLLSFILSLAGIGIIWNAGNEVFGAREAVRPGFYVLFVALFSVLINEALYQFTRRVGEKNKSKLLIANAWHHRSDSLSSIAVLIGVAAAWSGFMRFDAIAAVVVGVMIIRMAWKFGWDSIRELVDTGLDTKTLAKIKEIIRAVPGVCALHQLRTRSLAGQIFLDVHILVDPKISVSEGHYIGQQVHFYLVKQISDVTDVIVHVDPEDDELYPPALDLPGRAEIVNVLQNHWQGLVPADAINKINIHYLAGKIYLELPLHLSETFDKEAVEKLTAQLQQAIADSSYFASVRVVCYL